MGKQEFFELGDPSDTGSHNNKSRYRSARGCFVQLTTGAILLFLALILAIGVGLIVHFVEKELYTCDNDNKQAAATVNAQTGANGGQAGAQNGANAGQAGAQNGNASCGDLNKKCKELANTSPGTICSICPTQTPRQCPSPTPKRCPTVRPVVITPAAPTQRPSQHANIRLPRSLNPLQYDIEIKPNMYGADPSSFTFDGEVRIQFECSTETSEIVLHGKSLKIDKSSVRVWSGDSNEDPSFVEMTEDPIVQFLRFKVDKELVKGKVYYLEMKYSGPLRTDLAGLYLSSYQQDGHTQYLATTQFQPNDARKAFPCFDEPQYKAKFNITLVRKPGWRSLSNAAIDTQLERNGGYVADRFKLTKKMSTYLVAMVVSKFESNEGQTSRGVMYRTWAKPDSVPQAQEALNLGTKIISFYEDLFDIAFPLEKQDMIAIPDYPLGGMENWGLITYRETAMLYNPGVSSESSKQRVTRVIAHELSHMWFGDLVTTGWWDDLWLNEGFATYMEYVGSNFSHPEWKMFDQFTVKDMHDAFEFDSLRTSHPIYVPVNSPDEIGEIFDMISYSKGGSVIRMMKHFLGADTFNKGLTMYLRGHEYDVTSHDDLFEALEKQVEAEGKSIGCKIKDIIDTWILQMNYPVVMVTRGDNSQLHLKQKRFLLNKDSNQQDRFNSSFNYIWKVPFTYTTSTNPNQESSDIVWMGTTDKDITDRSLPSKNDMDSWVLGNPGQYGFYRVNYERSNWLSLVEQLRQQHDVIPVVNRAQIINDAWNLAKAGEVGIDIALQTVDYLDQEMDYVPWVAAKRELAYLDLMLSKSDVYGDFEKFMKAKLEPVYMKLGLDNTKSSHIEILLRSSISKSACGYGVQACKTAARDLFQQWMDNPQHNPIHPDLQSTVYCSAIADGGQDAWEFAFARYRESTVPSEISLIMSALACATEQWILRHYLDLSLNSSMIRSQDTLTVIEQVAHNPAGRLMAWDFTLEHWDYFRQKYGGAWNSFSRVVKDNTESFNTQHELEMLSDFVRNHADLGTANRAFYQAIENTETNIAFMKKNYNDIKGWLNDFISSSKTPGSEQKDIRLPRSVMPTLYELEMKPYMYNDDVANFNFTGRVTIHVHCKASTTNITLHANKLTIDHETAAVHEADSVKKASNEIGIANIEEDLSRQFVIVHLDQSLQADKMYTLYLEFSGPLKDDMTGIYLSSYKRGGKDIYMATTQMEPTDARKAFPCFDEPNLKAKFKVTLVRKSNLVSLSNMPREKTETRPGGFEADVYLPSEKMSTYLVAFVICDFPQGKTTITRNNITYGVWGRLESQSQLALALETGAETITFYEDFFGVKFPLPKQDMIAIPDFAAGAMENWGLITYRENSMLYKEGVSSSHDKQWTTETITHELAHQWFGDLVTMKWWDDLWLNEGFATFVQYLGADHKHKDWKMFDQFTVSEVQVGMEFDGLISSHPIYTPVNDPARINEFFDKISYSKGGSIIRMMQHFVGEETFKKGLKSYLSALKFSNAFHDDLWFAIGNQTGKDGHPMDVKSIMDTWTLQMNYPVVKFERLNSTSYKISQKRYLRDYDAQDPGVFTSPFSYLWQIPLTFTTSTEKNFDKSNNDVTLLPTPTGILNIHEGETSDWIIGNVQQHGYYRVNYDDQNWRSLIHQLTTDHKVIHTVNRGQLINDAWALAKSGDLPLATALETTKYLSKETDFVPWSAASKELSYVDSMLSRSPLYGDFKKYMADVTGGAFNLLGMENSKSDHLTKKARNVVVGLACDNDIPECKQEAANHFRSWMEDSENYMIDPDIKATVMCVGISEGGKTEWDFLYDKFKRSNVPNEKTMIMQALACSSRTWILRRYLELAIDPNEVKKQDAASVIQYIAGNVVGRDLAWSFLQEKWDIIMDRYGSGVFALTKIIGGVTSTFNTQLNVDQLKAFKASHPNMGSGTRAFDQSIEKTEANIRWMEKNYDVIQDWLSHVTLSSDKAETVRDVRLPRSVIPNLYELEIKPNMYEGTMENFNFTGSVKIHIHCQSSTNNITLHSNKLTIDHDSVQIRESNVMMRAGSVAIGVEGIDMDLPRQFLIIHLDQSLQEGNNYTLFLKFTGPLKDDLAGLYLSSYKRGDKTVYMATTQLESTDARKAFPCFDEPDLKAEYIITLVRRSDLVSLSNMPIQRKEDRGNGFIADVYRRSAKMSTYLVAFVICDFNQGLTRVTKHNITYGAWARPEAANQVQFALGVGAETLTYYEEFFGVPFPLPKQDMIAIPDFAAGAMENWGLITYRENSMLYKENVSSTGDKQWTATTITHELAHQWFGDYVTMRWWDDLWLNEGFATFVQYLGVDHLYPEWKMFEQFTIEELQDALSFDGLISSHPIYVPIELPEEINEIFDTISYSKGGSIIRMMRHFVGEETFKVGLKHYLESRAYSNAFHDDLWYSIGEQTKADGHPIDVKSIMDTWLLQMNYPVVKFERTNSGRIRVTQKRYLQDPTAADPGKFTSPFGYVWKVPITYTTQSEAIFVKDFSNVVMLNNVSSVIIPKSGTVKQTDWIMGNLQQYGFYRVNYDLDNWNKLIHQLNTDHTVIHPTNRGQLINDAWQLAKSGDLSIEIALQTTQYLNKELDYVPWSSAYTELEFVDKMMSRTPKYGDFKQYMANLIQGPFTALGTDNSQSEHLTKLARSTVVKIACKYNIQQCTDEATRQLQNWMRNPEQYIIDPDIKATMLCSGISEGGKDEWNFLYQRFQMSNVANEKTMIMKALACSNSLWILRRYLELSLDTNEIKKQDADRVIEVVAGNPVGRDMAWMFLQEKWDIYKERYGAGSFSFTDIIKGITETFTTELEANQLRSFQAEHPNMGSGQRAFEQAIESTKSNMKWMSKNYEVVGTWLNSVLSSTQSSNDLRDVRLPRSLIPEQYDLELFPDIYKSDPNTFTFDGKVTIQFICMESTNNITLHINNLDVKAASVKIIDKSGSREATPAFDMFSRDTARQFLIIHLTGYLVKGRKYTVYMEFSGPLTGDLKGLYLSTYQNGDETVYMATTHMEPVDARKAFPCFDEPDLKAKFKVTLVRKPSMVSLSNMPLERSENRAGGLIADHFQLSVPMSTYLLAFIVGKFKNNTGVTEHGIKYGAWSIPEAVSQTPLALDTGMTTLTFYEDYFNTSFPLPKQDMIAIPDFSSGAMENWGLITYRETNMLFKEGVSSEANRQRVTVVITHELAHQWFGNLVTMDWWDDLWLNEGFATFVQYLGAGHLHEEWKMFEQFTVTELQEAMDFDSLVTSHPLYAPVYNPSQIREIFDSISYSKGATIIEMMRSFVGDNTFRAALQKYLASKKYGNAVHDDLWFAVGNQSAADGRPMDVKGIMDTWTLQMNYPVVTVTRQNDGKVHLTQKRYLRNQRSQDPMKYVSPFGYQWRIPMTFTTSTERNFVNDYKRVVWFTDKQQILSKGPNIPADGWVIANLQQKGYYRVNYDQSNWQALIKQLNNDHGVIPPANRGQIINDAWALAKSEDISIELALGTLQYLKEEMDYVPWLAADTELIYVNRMLSQTALYGKFKAFVLSLVDKPFSDLGMDVSKSSHMEVYTKTKVAKVACQYDNTLCLRDAKSLFKKWMSEPANNPISPDMTSVVYCAGVKAGGQEEWDFLYDQYKISDVAAEKKRILGALSCTTKTWLLNRYLDLSLNPTEIRKQDADSVMIYVSQNPAGRDMVWNFFRSHWDRIYHDYGQSTFSMKNIIRGITSSFNTEFYLQQLEDFKKMHRDLGSGQTAMEQALESTQANIQWMKRNYDTIESWLDDNTVSPSTKSEMLKDVRLPRTVLPDLYELEIFPDFYNGNPENFTFSGNVKIHVHCVEDTSNITLHVHDLNIMKDSINVRPATNERVGGPRFVRTSEDLARQFLVLHLDGDLRSGQKYLIEMNYTGPLRDDMAGLYLSSYTRAGNTVYMVTTQFEATDARKAFPCFDEPDIKAKFQITLLRKPILKSISNMPQRITGQQRENGLVADVYQESPIMSTYLVAMIVCDFEHISATTKNNITYSAWATTETLNQTKFALEVGVDTITFYEEYFDIKFPLPKQDMIAIPDFPAGAMENWGLITYRETAMLYDPKVSTEANKQRVTTVITHELAHQWFGNLVTLDWWDDVWLNEGFADFVEHFGAAHKFPEWNYFAIFAVDELMVAFDFDGLVSSHPMFSPVYNPAQISEIFDTIAYAKGASVIRMMRFFVGENNFQKGIQNYLKNQKFKNAGHNDLWRAMETQVNNIPVREIMDTWILQMNYPTVSLQRVSGSQIKATQKRFLLNPNAKDPGHYTSKFGYQWRVPLTLVTKSDANFNKTYKDIMWLNDKEKTYDVPVGEDDWYIGNAQLYGYYRVNYDQDNWRKLIKQLKNDHKVIHLINRAQIINDAWNLAKAGDLDMGTPLNITDYLKSEMDYAPWRTAIRELSYVSTMLSRTALYGKFKNRMKSLIEGPFNKVNMTSTGKKTHLEGMLRIELSGIACGYGVTLCVEEAKRLFKVWMSDTVNGRVDPDVKEAVYCTAIAEGGAAEWEFLHNQYKTTGNAAEKKTILYALSCSTQVWLLSKYLSMSLDTSEVRRQDVSYVMSYVADNNIGRDLSWNFVRSNWDMLMENYGGSSFSFGSIVSGVTSSFNTEYELQQLRQFKDNHPNMGSATRAYEQALEKTQGNIEWMKKHYHTMEDWLSSKNL